jgi:tetratricopeptide (TPR) repeat protein
MRKLILILAAMTISTAILSAQDMTQATDTYNNGVTALSTGDKTSALAYFKQALTMGEACGADGETLVNNCKSAIPGIILSIGKELYNNKDIDGAISKFTEAAKAAKEYGVADVEKEASDLLAQMSVQKDMLDGNNALQAKDFTAAAEAYKKVLAADSTNTAAALHLGQALGASGDIDGAIKAFELAAANGEEKVANSQISTLYLKQSVSSLKAGKYSDAVTEAKKADSYEENPQSYLIIGQASQKLNKNSDAIEAFDKYLTLEPNAKNSPAIAFTVAVLYQKDGNKAKAIEYYKKIVTDPKFGATAQKYIAALSK